jgi:hypothetical protein
MPLMDAASATESGIRVLFLRHMLREVIALDPIMLAADVR